MTTKGVLIIVSREDIITTAEITGIKVVIIIITIITIARSANIIIRGLMEMIRKVIMPTALIGRRPVDSARIITEEITDISNEADMIIIGVITIIIIIIEVVIITVITTEAVRLTVRNAGKILFPISALYTKN